MFFHRLSLLPALLLATLLLATLPPVLAAREIGVFFTQYNTYVFSGGPARGKRILVRPRQTFAVVDHAVAPDDRTWYRVVLPGYTGKVTGEGWTPLAPHELLARGSQPVDIYSRVLETPDIPVATIAVPASDVRLLNVTQPSENFPQIEWQKVRYDSRLPQRAWVRGGAGIFRPSVTEAYLSRVYAEMVARNVPNKILFRLLGGVVRVGDTPRQVRWALGPPLRAQDDTEGDITRSTWQFPAIVVRFENGIVKQIN